MGQSECEIGSGGTLVTLCETLATVVNGLVAGADLNCQNNEGSTPLITAAVFCRTEVVKALLDNGADKTSRNKAGRNGQFLYEE
ncbi:MAG: ankyrin repeat domain-containing protein [Planctomycetes bacterium]|nr:ankyrin repeat domain-containing protein [Planctomycetota bacterium]MCP4607971.1 ankyrin repeat domain-containing protein [Planctomycetota bacterium]